MLGNRITRLISLVLLGIATMIVIAIFGGDAIGNSSCFMLSILSCYAIGIVYQLCADFLNFRFLDNMVGRIIKRVIFFASVVFVTFFGVMMYFLEAINSTYYPIESFGVIGQGCMISCFFSPIITALLCTVQDQIVMEQEKNPFIPVASLVASIILGIITAITGLYVLLPVILGVGAVVGMVYIMKTHGVVFDDSYSGMSYGGASSGGYGGTLGGGNSSFDDDDDDDGPPPDTRKNDGVILNQMSMRMHSIARSNSSYESLSRGAYLTYNVTSSASSRSVTFTVNSVLEIDRSYIEHQSDISCIQNEARSALNDIVYKIKSDAEDEIDSLRREFRDYDRSISIRVVPNSTRVQMR